MILKRMREQPGQQNWFGVAVDLAILILGVFLGIQVNNWNQDRLAKHAGQEYRQRIIGDIDSNRIDLVNRLTYFREGRGRARGFPRQCLSGEPDYAAQVAALRL